MAEVSEVIAALDRKLLAATEMHDKIKLQLDREQVFEDWLDKSSSVFRRAYNTSKSLSTSIKCFLGAVTMKWGANHGLSENLTNAIDRIEEIHKQLTDITDKYFRFYHTNLIIETNRKASICHIFLEDCHRLQQAKWFHSQTSLTEEQLGNIEVPNFLWVFNNLNPLHDPESLMDEYNCDVLIANLEQLANEFYELNQLFCVKTHGKNVTCFAQHKGF